MTSDEPAGLFYAALQHTRRSKKKHFRKHQDSMAGLTLLGEILHEEHFRILVWMCDLQNLVASDAGQRCPNACNHQERQELHALIRSLDEVLAHHVFEETIVFPLIRARGEGDLAGLLTGEHAAIEPITKRLRVITTEILRRGPGGGRWAQFRKLGNQLVSEMTSHLEKEELAIVQRLDSLLDADSAHRLAFQHIAARLPPAAAMRTSNRR
jgi:hemerythrin-like domain-containing protein